jgi:hypothetical protein
MVEISLELFEPTEADIQAEHRRKRYAYLKAKYRAKQKAEFKQSVKVYYTDLDYAELI